MAYKKGDKIVIKNKPKQDNKINKYEEILKDLSLILSSSKYQEVDKLECANMLLPTLENWFIEDEFKPIKYAKNKLIPLLSDCIEKTTDKYMPDFFEIYKNLYIFCARRDLECFIDYMEWDMPKKVLAPRRNVLKPYVDALQKIAFDSKIEYLIVSLPPNFGKSYILNNFTAWSYGIDINNSNLRISYSYDLVAGFSRTIKSLVSSPKFADVFNQYKLYGGKCFDVDQLDNWHIKNSIAPKSHIIRTREGSTTGERANFAIIFDDLCKGAEEANNITAHEKNYNSWTTEWWNRKANNNVKYIFVGTLWCPEDILNRVKNDREQLSPFVDTDIPYTQITEDGSTILIRTPMLDENGKTTCPEIYSQANAEFIQRTTDPILFSAVYQQDPKAPTGREFADELLLHYNQLPLHEDGTPAYSNGSYAVLDPARKGKDNVAMPIHKHGNDDFYYMVDCIFQQKPMTDLYDLIVDKIIEHTIVELVIENNTDTSLKSLIDVKLKEKNYFLCNIREKYNTANKEQRIKDSRGIVKSRIKFKEKTSYLPNSDYGRYMKNLSYYSFDYPNLHDDAPDASSMMASEIILNKTISKPIPIDRREYGI